MDDREDRGSAGRDAADGENLTAQAKHPGRWSSGNSSVQPDPEIVRVSNDGRRTSGARPGAHRSFLCGVAPLRPVDHPAHDQGCVQSAAAQDGSYRGWADLIAYRRIPSDERHHQLDQVGGSR